MLEAIKKEFPAGVTCTYPEGGLFTWCTMPEHLNAKKLMEVCIQKNVAFVPGDSFFPNSCQSNTFRMNYSNMPEDKIVEGIKRIGEVLREALEK